MKNKHPFNCLVCDGFTTVRAKFSKEAAIKLQNHSKFDNLAKLSSQAILNIPKFRIMVTPSGSDSDRIQLLIDYVGIVNSQKVDDSGNPRPFHLRTGVATLLKQVELLMHPRSESEAPENLPTQRRTRVMKNGYYTQEFATQIRPSLQGAGFEMLGGANLAPPVVPHRNDGAKVFGMQSMTRENNQNAYDNLMSLMPDVITTTKTASAVVSATQPFASQPPSQITPNVTHNESNEEGDSDLGDNASEEVVDLTRSQSSNSRPLVRPQVDGTVEDAIKRMNNYSYGNPHWHEMDEHEMMSHVGGNRGPVADIARDPITAHPQNEQASGVSNNKDREIETSRQAGSPKLPIVRQHNDRDKDRDTRTLPQTPSRREARPVPPGRDVMQKFKPRSWAVSFTSCWFLFLLPLTGAIEYTFAWNEAF
jgi:hypothetical protein